MTEKRHCVAQMLSAWPGQHTHTSEGKKIATKVSVSSMTDRHFLKPTTQITALLLVLLSLSIQTHPQVTSMSPKLFTHTRSSGRLEVTLSDSRHEPRCMSTTVFLIASTFFSPVQASLGSATDRESCWPYSRARSWPKLACITCKPPRESQGF